MALGNLSVVLPPWIHQAQTPFGSERPLLIHFSIHRLHKMPSWVFLHLRFWGKHPRFSRFIHTPIAAPSTRKDTSRQAHGKSLFVMGCSHARSGPGTAGIPPTRQRGTSQHPAALTTTAGSAQDPQQGWGCERKSLHPNSLILCSGEAAASQERGASVWAEEPSPQGQIHIAGSGP